MDNTFSHDAAVFQGIQKPESGRLAGYAAIIEQFGLAVPIHFPISLISEKHKQYSVEKWNVFTPRHAPEPSLFGHLEFALKYEGIQLIVFKQLFDKISEKEVEELVRAHASKKYGKKIWFLYEWLMQKKLQVNDADTKSKYILLVNPAQQFALQNGQKSTRHRIINNLPGNRNCCPMVRKTAEIHEYINKKLATKLQQYHKGVSKTLMQRAASFLLIEDSKASFKIEDEQPSATRAQRWANAMARAGQVELSLEELLHLQHIVLGNNTNVQKGFRQQGGFVGEHDPQRFMPLPEHISANPTAIEPLLRGLIQQLKTGIEDTEFPPVVLSAMVAFCFVYIHPFVDGNGRIHRFLFHHILTKKKWTGTTLPLPISAAILESMEQYATVLRNYSHALLPFIEWQVTDDYNIEVTNDTIDYYRYLDVTEHVAYTYSCIEYMIDQLIPKELAYLQSFDAFKKTIDGQLELAAKDVSLLAALLHQNKGTLSKTKRNSLFAHIDDATIEQIEQAYATHFTMDDTI